MMSSIFIFPMYLSQDRLFGHLQKGGWTLQRTQDIIGIWLKAYFPRLLKNDVLGCVDS